MTRGFKNGIKYCQRCRTGRKYQTGSTITIEINRTKLISESYGHGRTPRKTNYKRTCQAKKRPDVGRPSNGTHRIIFSDKNGTCTPQLMRMHEIKTGFIWSSTYTDQCGTWVLGAERIDIGSDGSRTLRICRQWGGGWIHRLANTYLFVEAQIVADDDTALDAGADVGPVNVWMHSLFSDVSVSLNEKLVSPPTSLYPYRAYIETLLSYGPPAKESQLTGVMWYKDTPGRRQTKQRNTSNDIFG